MHATFTSGAARRRDLTAARLQNPEHELIDQDIEGVNAEHDAAGRINPILDLLRDEWDAPNAHFIAVEYLMQLARHWSAWQDARMGTFPLDYRDPSGPTPRDLAFESGEDRVFWEIDDALAAIAGLTTTDEDRWGSDDRDLSVDDRILGYIVHATAVLTRIYEATKEDA